MFMCLVGLRPEKGCAGSTQQKLKTTDPTSLQRGRPTLLICNCIKIIKERKKNWSGVLDGCLTPRQTGRLTIGRNITCPCPCNRLRSSLFVVICEVWRTVRTLLSLLDKSCKSSINPTISSKFVYSHSTAMTIWKWILIKYSECTRFHSLTVRSRRGFSWTL
jgi:hypothetical protein